MKKKVIIALVLSLVVVCGLVCSLIFLLHKPDAVITDLTEGQSTQQQENEVAINNGEALAVISPTVNLYEGDEAAVINGSIKSVTTTNNGIIVRTNPVQTGFNDLGVGDIFCLEGSETTPFEQTFIGKIESKAEVDGEIEYIVGTPSVDEVFDVLKFDYTETLTNDKIAEIETVEGVTVSKGLSLAEEFGDAQIQQTTTTYAPRASSMSYKTENKPVASPTVDGAVSVDKDSLVFEYEIDLLKTFGLEPKGSAEFKDVYTIQEADRINVFTTTTGSCYHRDTCPCVGRSKYQMTLAEANSEGFDPCYLCNPPALKDDDGVFRPDATLTLSGKAGVEDIAMHVKFFWDILSGKGLEDLSIQASGNAIVQSKLESQLKFEFGGRTTTISLPFGAGHFQGLNEKLFPLAFVGYNAALTPVTAYGSNEQIRAVTAPIPLTIGVLVYADASGSITLSSTVEFSASCPFSYNNDLVVDGQWVCNPTATIDPSTHFSLSTELKGDIDAHFGISAMLYVFNLNLCELAFARAGVEAGGLLKIEYSSDFSEEGTASEITADYYMRGYYKLLLLTLKVKAKIDIWNIIDFKGAYQYEYLYKDETLFSFGQKGATNFSDGTMSFSHVAAKDAKSLYYMDTNGQLIKETNGNRSVLYAGDFFIICGIDESYIYILKVADEGGYDLYRIGKENGTEKRILDSLAYLLLFDESHIYYTTTFDKTIASRIDREDLSVEMFIDIDDEIRYMEKQGDNFYVVAQSTDPFAAFLGGGNTCRLINSSGVEIANYGENVTLENYCYTLHNDTFYSAARIVSGGFLRSTATEIYWVSKNQTQNNLTKSVSGWSYCNKGIVVVQDVPADQLPAEKLDENGNPIPVPKFKIVIYEATTGQPIDVCRVFSNQALFTFKQAGNGRWYFFDQNDEELILYSMSEDLSSIVVEKTFKAGEIPCNLSTCSVAIVDKTLFFYTMSDDRYTTILYRYNIV